MKKTRLSEKNIFIFIVKLKPHENDEMFTKAFFGWFDMIDNSNYDKITKRLEEKGVIVYSKERHAFLFTRFGSLLGCLEFKRIRSEGHEKEIRYLNYLVKIGAFSHMPRN